MTAGVYRFEFAPSIPLEEVELSLHVARLALEGIFGAARSRLEFGYFADKPHHTITVDGTTEVGMAVALAFTHLISTEFGAEAFQVRQVNSQQLSSTSA